MPTNSIILQPPLSLKWPTPKLKTLPPQWVERLQFILMLQLVSPSLVQQPQLQFLSKHCWDVEFLSMIDKNGSNQTSFRMKTQAYAQHGPTNVHPIAPHSWYFIQLNVIWCIILPCWCVVLIEDGVSDTKRLKCKFFHDGNAVISTTHTFWRIS